MDSETSYGSKQTSIIMGSAALRRAAFWALRLNSKALFYAYSHTLLNLLLQDEGSLTLLPILSICLTSSPPCLQLFCTC